MFFNGFFISLQEYSFFSMNFSSSGWLRRKRARLVRRIGISWIFLSFCQEFVVIFCVYRSTVGTTIKGVYKTKRVFYSEARSSIFVRVILLAFLYIALCSQFSAICKNIQTGKSSALCDLLPWFHSLCCRTLI